MSVKIVKSNQALIIKTIVAVFYGEPGWGKTSLAFTAEKPLLLDFDGGSHRSGFRKDVVRIESWDDVVALDEGDLQPYKTIVTDTVGRLLDMLSADLIKHNSKLAQRSGALTLQGYGELKASFQAWLKKIRSYGLDVVLVAHNKEERNGDDMILRPDVQGGSYNEIFKVSDTVGFGHILNNERVLEFSPSDSWVGKNPAQFDPINVPDFNQVPNFLGSLILSIKNYLNELSEAQSDLTKKIESYRKKIQKSKTAAAINKIFHAVTEDEDEDPAVVKQVRALVAAKAKELNLVANKETKQFEKAEKETA